MELNCKADFATQIAEVYDHTNNIVSIEEEFYHSKMYFFTSERTVIPNQLSPQLSPAYTSIVIMAALEAWLALLAAAEYGGLMI